ncbi:MAG: glycosyltransferase family 2 protein [Humidesulfovibrio sp.]|nr:glycosyltransferase family 2 protein [Humidesulfovibrio sp.]
MSHPTETADRQQGYSALVLNYGHWNETIACLDSLLAGDRCPERIVVCDNSSPDDSLQRLAEWARERLGEDRLSSWREMGTEDIAPVLTSADGCLEEFILLRTGGNLGYAGGNNVGLRLLLGLGAQFVWLLNNDTTVLPGTGSALLRHMRANPRCGLCGTLTRYMAAPEIVQCYGGGWYSKAWGRGGLHGEGAFLPLGRAPATPQAPLDYVNGASVFLRREFLLDVGLMEERYFLYCEEIDWAERAKGRWELGFAPDAEVLHLEGLSTGMSNHRRLRRSVKSTVRLVRSRLLFTLRHCPWFLPTVFLGQAWATASKILRVLAARR